MSPHNHRRGLQDIILDSILARFIDDVALFDTLKGAPPRNQWPSPVPLFYIFYTSGTSGKPKGKVITCGSIVNITNSIRQRRDHPIRQGATFTPFWLTPIAQPRPRYLHGLTQEANDRIGFSIFGLLLFQLLPLNSTSY